MLRYVLLGLGSLVGLLWLSTFSDNDIQSKMDFYSGSAGKFVVFCLFILPLTKLMGWMNSEDYSRKQLAVRISALISVQIIVLAFAPNIVKAYNSSGSDIAAFVIYLKSQ